MICMSSTIESYCLQWHCQVGSPCFVLTKHLAYQELSILSGWGVCVCVCVRVGGHGECMLLL